MITPIDGKRCRLAKVARRQAAEKEAGRSLELIANLARLFWDDVADRISMLVRSLIEEFLEAGEQRSSGQAPTNGPKAGTATEAVRTAERSRPSGEVKIRVPRVAGGTYELEIIDRWGRRQVELDEAIGRLPLAGVSTRRLEKVAEELWGIGLSRSQVSDATKRLDAEVASFRGRRIPDTVRSLLAGGISAKVIEVGVEGKVFLVAYGIHTGGRRDILGFVLADSESAAAWGAFLGDLKARGLKGRALRLITTCGSKGLRKAVAEVCPLVRVQRCLVHRIRNVLRRRTRPMGMYVNPASADRIMFGVTEEMNERWRGAPQLARSASSWTLPSSSNRGPSPRRRSAPSGEWVTPDPPRSTPWRRSARRSRRPPQPSTPVQGMVA